MNIAIGFRHVIEERGFGIAIVTCERKSRKWRGKAKRRRYHRQQWRHSRSWRRSGRERTERCTEQERERLGRLLPSRRLVFTRTTKAFLPPLSARSPSCACSPEIPMLSGLSFFGFLCFASYASFFFFSPDKQLSGFFQL